MKKHKRICRWTEDEDGNWDTDCVEKHVLNVGGPYENKMVFCCYCGRSLKQVTFSDRALQAGT